MGDFKEKCGVFGVSSSNFEAARITFYGLFALQHRGQESSGIATSDGKKIYRHAGQGLVAHVYSEELFESNLFGPMAVGHNRYSTSGGANPKHSQPVMDGFGNVVLAHNGNLPITKRLTAFLENNGVNTSGLNDSEKMQRAISYYVNVKGFGLEEAVAESYKLFEGAFSVLVMDKTKLIAFRDKFGIRPLSFGKLNSGYIVASETCALDAVGATFVRDVLPGEMIVFESDGKPKSFILEKGEQKLDIFEFIYFARPDSVLLGKNVWQARFNIGVNAAKEHPRDADIVIDVPDSATPMAIGYSEQSGIPHHQGLIKNRYVHRTFIMPDSHQKWRDISMKSNPIPAVLRGKRVIVIDDSIVKGNTAADIIENKILKIGGAASADMIVGSPPLIHPDPFGIDLPRYKNLIASRMSLPEIARKIGVKYLGYISLKGVIDAIGLPPEMLTAHCFDGKYPIDIKEWLETSLID